MSIMKLKWIDSRQRLPKLGEKVLCCDIDTENDQVSSDVLFTGSLETCNKNHAAKYVYYIEGKAYGFNDILYNKIWSVSHWMPLLPIPTKMDTKIEVEVTNRFEILDL